MKLVDHKQIHSLRKKHNLDVIKRMRDGDSLKGFDSQSSWFPPRPVIKKDPKAIAKLYGKYAPESSDGLPREAEPKAAILSLTPENHSA